MFIGHLPAGYICTTLLFKLKPFRNLSRNKKRIYFLAGMIGSVFPDIDIFYFYFADGKQNVHHSYWTHIPSFWLMILCSHLLLSKIMRNKRTRDIIIFFIANVFIHLLLDTIVGGIFWLYPFSQKMFTLLTVPAKSTSWFFNFLFYWTISIEGALVLLATFVYKLNHFPRKNNGRQL